jgi:glycosyltransferase involved in cell wall biosynthesis
MKILFFSSYFYPYTSGLTTYPWKILNHLSRNHQVIVLTFNHKENKLKNLKIHPPNRRVKNSKLKIIYLPYLFRLFKGFISPQSFFYFFKEVKNTNLVFFNQPNVEGLPLMLLAKIFKKKTLSLLHCFLETNKRNLLDYLIIKLANKVVELQLLLSDKSHCLYKKLFRKFFYLSKNQK